MAGLETILEKIAEDSKTQCADLTAKAEREADAIRSQAREDASAAASAMLARAKTQADILMQKAESAAKTTRSRAVLAEKVAMISEVLSQAAERIRQLPDAEYAAVIKKLAVKHAKNGSGILRLSPADAARLPAGFEADLNAALSGKGSLRLETAQQKSGGFVLVYGDIEQNCTLDALIDSMQDALKDKIRQVLFA